MMPKEKPDDGSTYDQLNALIHACFTGIKTSSRLNVGAKTVLLEKVITADWQELSSLFDEIFCPDQSTQETLECIRSLKRLHDLYTNAIMKVPGSETEMQALNYYLPAMAIDKEKHQNIIKMFIDKQMAKLKRYPQVARQRVQWNLTRTARLLDNGWTTHLDLTPEQLEISQSRGLKGSAYDILSVLMTECFETIRDYPLLNPRIKMLLLEDAMTLDWQGLAARFDKIFRPDLRRKKLVLSNIDLIKALKCIHDLYTNAALRLPGDYGNKETALEYYMPCCAIDMKKHCYTMEQFVYKEIHDLNLQQPMVRKRPFQWDALPSSSGWIEYLDLTQEQMQARSPLNRNQYFISFNEKLPEVLTPKQHLLLLPGVAQTLLAHKELVLQLKGFFALENIEDVQADELSALLKCIPQFKILAGQELPPEFWGYLQEEELQAVIRFSELIDLPHPIRMEILKNAPSLLFLLLKIEDLTLSELFAIPSCAREKIFSNPQEVYELTSHDYEERNEIFRQIAPFFEVLNFDEINTLVESNYFDLLIAQTEEMILLLNNHADFEDLLSSPELIKNKALLVPLLKKEKITFAQFNRDFTEDFISRVINNMELLLDVFKRYPISLRILARLSLQQLDCILEDPNSSSAREILRPWPFSSNLYPRERTVSQESSAKLARFGGT